MDARSQSDPALPVVGSAASVKEKEPEKGKENMMNPAF